MESQLIGITSTTAHGDYVEWMRLVADACDGLARPAPTAVDALAYRRSVWNPTQATWIESVLSS